MAIDLNGSATGLSGGLFKEVSFSVRITNVNEAPTSLGGEATMNQHLVHDHLEEKWRDQCK